MDRFVISRSHWLALVSVLALSAARMMAQQGGAPPAHVHHHEAAPVAQPEAAPSGPTKVAIPDVTVFDQDNHKVHFYSDLIKGRTVAVNFIFTTCTTICPPLTANFARVQKTLMEKGKTGVHLISISVDPEGDTPAKMKDYAAMFHAQPGWTFVTGSRADLEQIWRAFSVTSTIKQDHPATVVIGNDSTHTWTYASGLTSANKLVAAVESVLEKDSAPAAENIPHGEKHGNAPQ